MLLIKVYQDNMASLMKLNAELNGQTELLNQLGTELEKVNKELASLSAKGGGIRKIEAGSHNRIVGCRSVRDSYSRRADKLRGRQEEPALRLRVVQKAITPTAPVFPQVSQLVALAIAGGILLGLGGIFGPEIAKSTMSPASNQATAVADQDQVTNLLMAAQRGDRVRGSIQPGGLTTRTTAPALRDRPECRRSRDERSVPCA